VSDPVNQSTLWTLDDAWKSPKVCPCPDPTLCRIIRVQPEKEILAFQVDSSNWIHYNLSVITTVAMFTNTLDPKMICALHRQNVRIVYGVGYPYEQLGNATQRSIWVQQMVDTVKNTFIDGVNVDIEYEIQDGSVQQKQMVELMKELKTAFSPLLGSQVTFDVAWSPNCIDGRCYDSKGLADNSDFLVVMGYDLRSQIFGPCIASANSPIHLVQNGIKNFTNLGINPNKLVLGVPWYGYDYTCVNAQNETVCPIEHVPFRGVNCSDAAGRQRSIADIRNLFVVHSTTRLMWDSEFEAPWFDYLDEQNGIQHQVWFDDVRSLSIKYEFAKSTGLRGLAFWNVDCLDFGPTYHAKEETLRMWEALTKFL